MPALLIYNVYEQSTSSNHSNCSESECQHRWQQISKRMLDVVMGDKLALLLAIQATAILSFGIISPNFIDPHLASEFQL